ncbi:cytochrome d ubiquinol oxidase subunit II [Fictibacillus sp. WQ 8-8]|uniref:cytochrome d ubiquinol oxidase subunit II n=1 Tax=unclassified Fictibacillus TaxID=2644029 RepID=UPI00210B57EC|nr:MULTISPECIES: cytochrome d ubiquinol oxidase subunit II [unclassified Fictibacillus]MCQ6266523.1 cytochrome d ubiquinol oxidase subunit II [Fictibacillus sp. WQ 8-8]MED2971544.1 cytochrome d ubiquinol oxidase subunit II [Fictibacillus sp. B-59209]
MNEEVIAILVLWTFIFIYSIFGSIDFGAGFWAMIYNDHRTFAGKIANRFLSPTWEITNVFLVLLVVAFVGFFPKGAFTLGTVLLIPISLILFLLSIRSAFMVFSYSVQGYRKTMFFISGVCGVLIPALLITVLPVSQGGFIEGMNGKDTLLLGKLFTSPSLYMYILFGLTSELFLSSLFLADYSRVSKQEGAYRLYRGNVLILGPSTLLAAVITLLVIQPEAGWLLDNLYDQRIWFILSTLAFIVGYASLWLSNKDGKAAGKPRVALLATVAQYGLASYGYGMAHLPYIVYPSLTIYDAFTAKETFYSLMIMYAVGLAILTPGFYVFWRLFLKDKRYLQQD